MTCLDLVLDKINPLGFLHLDVEGWDTYALLGAGEALRGIDNTCFVVCEVWYERYRKRRHLFHRDAYGFRPPYDNVISAIVEYPNFEYIYNIVDQDRNLGFRFRGSEDSGEGDDDDS